jgi:hypothetical protein
MGQLTLDPFSFCSDNGQVTAYNGHRSLFSVLTIDKGHLTLDIVLNYS